MASWERGTYLITPSYQLGTPGSRSEVICPQSQLSIGQVGLGNSGLSYSKAGVPPTAAPGCSAFGGALAQTRLLAAVAPGLRDDTASARMRLPRRPEHPRPRSAGSALAPVAAAAAALDGRCHPRPPEERTPHLRCLERPRRTGLG